MENAIAKPSQHVESLGNDAPSSMDGWEVREYLFEQRWPKELALLVSHIQEIGPEPERQLGDHAAGGNWLASATQTIGCDLHLCEL